jgi:hypothetical protein
VLFRSTTLESGGEPNSVAADGTHVYWTDLADRTVNEMPLGGGSITTLATSASSSFGFFSVAVGS